MATAGRIELNLGNIGNALALLLRAERLRPRDPRGWFITLGIAAGYLQTGRFDEAISSCRSTLNQNPRNTMVLRMLAACLVKQGRKSEAAQVAREVLALEPQLTLAKLRARSAFMNTEFWNEYLAALQGAGIPE
jgi:Flp pilus assembly protein TadD